jgi:hypothetical protein
MAKKATEKAVPKVETPPVAPEPVESEHDRLEREGLN